MNHYKLCAVSKIKIVIQRIIIFTIYRIYFDTFIMYVLSFHTSHDLPVLPGAVKSINFIVKEIQFGQRTKKRCYFNK